LSTAFSTAIMPTRTFANLTELAACVGQELVVSDWTTITQEQVNQFAQATGDHQWIHVDVDRAKSGPFGAPIAHGFLTLSLLAKFGDESIKVASAKMGVNYGLNKVRFISPVPVGSRLRARFKLLAIEPLPAAGGLTGQQATTEVTVELEGSTKPACVAESIGRRYE
jgi:acyl dehydratase